jgi:hypothetical protein
MLNMASQAHKDIVGIGNMVSGCGIDSRWWCSDRQ